jgi:hypothetical protein
VQLAARSRESQGTIDHRETVEIAAGHSQVRHQALQLGEEPRPARGDPPERELALDDRQGQKLPSRQLLEREFRDAILRW